MKIIQKIDDHEVLRRIAIGEINSGVFNSDQSYKQWAHKCLQSNNHNLELEAIKAYLDRSGREPFLRSLPVDTVWYLASVEPTLKEFSQIRTVDLVEWRDRSDQSCDLIRASKYIEKCPEVDPRVTQIARAFLANSIELNGITLHTTSLNAPRTIVEGHGRLIAIFRNCVESRVPKSCKESYEVTLGVSTQRWCLSPH